MIEISGLEENSVSLKNERAGLSLIEVMIALCIVSVLMGIGSFTLHPLWKKHQLNTAVNSFISDIQLMRMKAILEKRTFQMKISGGVLFYHSMEEVTWSQWNERQLDKEVTYSMSGVTSFYDKGFASPKTIILKGNEYSRKVIININGRTRTSEIY